MKINVMQVLEVPYRQQISESSCGAAAFEMVYKYLKPSKLSKFSQQKVFNRLKEQTPSGTNVRMSTNSIMDLARSRGLESDWGRVNPSPERLVEQATHFIETEKLPLIACQQWHADKSLGHFRVIIGIDEREVIFHDPEPTVGGAERRLPLHEFIDAWRWTFGGNVIGGVAIWIANRQIKSTLDPDTPNLWASNQHSPQ
jgi:ABC-type bacteriocin/lantibiotic exporter with double-glycine peptidase domain